MKQSFPRRYAANWRQIRQQTLQLTGDRCCLCAAKAKEVHHVRYGLWDGKRYRSIAGKERPLIDVFPLCNSCHTLAHAPHHWVWDKVNPELGNHNRPEFVQYLQAGLKPHSRQADESSNEEATWGSVVGLFFRLLLT